MLKFYWGASLAVLLVATPALAQETAVPLQDENTATTDPKRDRSEASDILVMGQRAAATLMAGLEVEFGRGAGEALAHRFLEAEETDFFWDARIEERWLGSYESIGDDDLELDRIAICGRLDGRWFASVMLVDGDGMAHGILAKRFCRSWKSAREALADAR
ncbi:hypothetical protein [uncultured Novosphingobium sp.]|uniref:hypothetical protein n=1 Tax=uncultured Novosphingobium sp. TaxID=292277 RepID=UPI00258E09E8|nr:hypothetical protein [uncultured Novosphingobium sp.]